MLLVLGCGEAGNTSSNSSTGAAGSGGSLPDGGGTGGSGSGTCTWPSTIDENAFFPAGIPHEDGGSPGLPNLSLEIVGASLLEWSEGKEWLVAVRNNGSTTLHESIIVSFIDANGMLIGAAEGWIDGSLCRIGASTLERCLGAGEVGIATALISAQDLMVEDVTREVKRIHYFFNGLVDPNATKFTDVTLQNVVLAKAGGMATSLSGTMANHGTFAIRDPEVRFYPINGAGRPLELALDRADMTVAPGSTWDFNMPLCGPIDKYALFARYTGQ